MFNLNYFKMKGVNITSPSWWLDSKGRTWIVFSIIRSGPNFDGVEIQMIEYGKTEVTRSPYEDVAKLVAQDKFYPVNL
jgi:hypothetical protein